VGDNLPGGVICQRVRHPDGRDRFTYMSAGIERILGIKAERVLADPAAFLQRILEEDRPRLKALEEAALRDLTIMECEFRQRAANGQVKWIHARSCPRRLEDRSTVWDGVVMDITEQKQAEAGLRQWADAFEHCAHGIALGKPGANRILACNPAFVRMLRRPGNEVIGTSILSVHVLEDQERVRSWIAEADRNGMVRYECLLARLDGSTVPVQMDVASVRDATGQPVYWVATAQDITERKRADALVREQLELQDQLTKVAATVPGLICSFRTGPDGSISMPFATPAIRDIYGVAPEDVRDDFLPVSDRVHPDDRDHLEASITESASTLEPWIAVYRVRHPQKGELWLEACSVPRREPDGSTLWHGFVQDVTARKHAEAQARLQEARLRLALEAAEMVTWELEVATGRISYSSGLTAGARVRDVRSRLSLKSYTRRVHPEDREKLGQAVARTLETGVPFDCEYRMRGSAGSWRWVASKGGALTGEAGQPDRLLGVSQDITKRKELEENLRRFNLELERRVVERTAELSAEVAQRKAREVQLRKLWSAVEQSPASVVITDHAATMEYVNPQFERSSGYTLAEAVGQTPRLLKSGIHPSEFYAAMWRTLAAGQTWRGDICNQRKDGTLYWESTAIAPVCDPTGRTTHFVAIKEDITEARRVAEELRQAKEKAEAANRAKSVFLANMSHEIRTPMNAILGFTQLLLREPETSDSQHQRLSAIARSGQHLLHIINEILEMARIESGQMAVTVGPFDLPTVLRDLADMFNLRAGTQGIAFTIQSAPGLPHVLVADETKLRQVLINLLGNAFKFTPAGGRVGLRLEGTPEAQGRWLLQAEVEDSGPGMTPEEMSRLFEPFFQTQTGRAAGGTGLGLTISRQIARLMGGDLTASSESGTGSRFVFQASVQEAEGEALPEAHVRHEVPSLAPASTGCRVLVADDTPENRDLLKDLLAPLGFDVRTAVNGLDAVEQCAAWTPRLIVLDLRMPVLDGFGATRRLRATHGAGIKILALSASIAAEIQEQALAAGADGFLGKPFHYADLLERIRELTGVEYARGAPLGPGEPGMESPPTEGLFRLPTELANALRRAVASADYEDMQTLAAQVSAHDQALGFHLQRLIERFAYEPLLALLNERRGD
jgi:PAS domain S-box-containing protein